MYVNVNVNVTDYEKLRELFRSSLVDEFSPRTSILFSDNVLKMRLFFEETPPKQSIYSMCDCGTITYLEYNSGEMDFEPTTPEDQQVTVVPKPESASEEAKVAEKPQSKSAPTEPKPVKKEKLTSKKKAFAEIPEVANIAANSHSKQEYLTQVHTFLDIAEDRLDTFDNILDYFNQADKPTWGDTVAALTKKGIKCGGYDKKLFSQAAQKLNIPFWKLIATICHYMNEIAEAAEVEGEVEEAVTEDKAEDQSTNEQIPETSKTNEEQSRSMFSCMPTPSSRGSKEQALEIEANIRSITGDSLTEKLASSIKVLSLLQPTLFNVPGSLDNFIKSSTLIVSNEEITFEADKLLDKTSSTYEEDAKELRYSQLRWASLAHTLAKMYDPDRDTDRIKAQKFLHELREILRR